MISSKITTKLYIMAITLALIAGTMVNGMEQQELSWAQVLIPKKTTIQKIGTKLITCLIGFLTITGQGFAQQTQPSVQLNTNLPMCELNKTRIETAAQKSYESGHCIEFCTFPYQDAYYNCQPNEYHMAACTNKDLTKTWPEDLIAHATDQRKTTVDFFIYNSAHEDESDIVYLQYPANQYTSDPPECAPFNKKHYDETVALARKTGKCQLLCIEPNFDCNQDGGSKLIYSRLYVYALCTKKAFETLPDDCKAVIQNLGDDDTMAMGFLWNKFERDPHFNRTKTSLLECPMRKKPKHQGSTKKGRRAKSRKQKQ